MSKKAKVQKVKGAAGQVEIVFDFTKVPLFDFLDLMELSAAKETGREIRADETLKFTRCLRAAYVSSSRPLTVADFEATITAFWKNAQLFKDPNG